MLLISSACRERLEDTADHVAAMRAAAERIRQDEQGLRLQPGSGAI